MTISVEIEKVESRKKEKKKGEGENFREGWLAETERRPQMVHMVAGGG